MESGFGAILRPNGCGVAFGAGASIVRANLAAGPDLALPSPQETRGFMFISPAYAQGSIFGFGGGNTDMLTSLLPFVLIFVIMYFLILRPQQKRVKQHAEMVKNVRKGDTVVTSGGLVGRITKVIDDDTIEVEVADGVRVRQMRSMVSDVRAKGEPLKDDSSS
jgi:preprotein translocase subunit YajC